MKKLPDNLAKLDSLQSKEDFLALVNKLPNLSKEEAGWATHICNKYFKDNCNDSNLNDDEMVQIVSHLDVSKNARKLFEWFDRRLSFLAPTYPDIILKKVLFFGAKDKKSMIGLLGEYFTVAYNNNNIVQMNLLAEFHPSTMDATVERLLGSGRLGENGGFVNLLVKNHPQLLLSHQKFFQEDLVLNVAKCTTDLFLEDFYFGVGFVYPKVKKEIVIHRVANFLNILGADSADNFFTDSLWSLGRDFYDAVAKEMDINAYLSGSVIVEFDATGTGGNFVTRKIELNRFQYMFFTKTSNDNVFELAEVFKENFYLFNKPVIERINNIDFVIDPVELAFKTNAMSGVFDYFTRVSDQLNPQQEKIFASVFMCNLLKISNTEFPEIYKFIFKVAEDLFENIRKDSVDVYMDAFQHVAPLGVWRGAEDVEKLLQVAYLSSRLSEKENKKSLYKI